MLNRICLLLAVPLLISCQRSEKSSALLAADGAWAPSDAASAFVESMPPPTAIPEQEGAMRRGRHDPTSSFMQAASMLSVSYARQTTLEGIQSRLASDEAKLAAARDTLRKDLIADIRRGTLDAARLKRDEAAIERAAQALMTDQADGLNALHAACDPLERRTLVDHVRVLPSAREPSRAGPESEDAYEGNRENPTRRQLDRMTADLDLDEAQQRKVADIEVDAPSTWTDERDARWKQLSALLAAFTTDSFDAKPIMISKESSAARDSAQREVVLVSRLLPILRPPQREKLALNVESRRLGHGRGDAGTLNPHE